MQMDNASIHNDAANVLFQSPYSPDLNPVEKVFGLIKQRMKHEEYSTDSLEDIVTNIVDNISRHDMCFVLSRCLLDVFSM